MIKKLMSIIVFLVLMLPLVASTEAMTMPYPYPGSGLQNNQYYTVVFDEEKEATVLAKLEFQNTDKNLMRNVVLEFPEQVQIINAVQEIRVPRDKYGGWNYEYKTININRLLSSYNFNLDQPIEEQESATIIIYYKARGHVDKNLGVYEFNFETIKSDYHINNVQVAINVQDELHLKDVEGDVNYVDNFFPTGKMYGETMAMEMSSYSGRIGHYGGITKHASGLDPFESFSVSGEYAKSKFWLNRWAWLTGLVISSVILLSLVYMVRSLFRSNRRTVSREDIDDRRNLKDKKDLRDRKESHKRAYEIREDRSNKHKEILLSGFISALIPMITVSLSLWLMDNLRHWMDYRSADMAGLLIGFVAFIVVLASLVLPPIYVGKKYQDFMAGMMTVVAMIGWLILFSLLLLVFFLIF